MWGFTCLTQWCNRKQQKGDIVLNAFRHAARGRYSSRCWSRTKRQWSWGRLSLHCNRRWRPRPRNSRRFPDSLCTSKNEILKMLIYTCSKCIHISKIKTDRHISHAHTYPPSLLFFPNVSISLFTPLWPLPWILMAPPALDTWSVRTHTLFSVPQGLSCRPLLLAGPFAVAPSLPMATFYLGPPHASHANLLNLCAVPCQPVWELLVNPSNNPPNRMNPSRGSTCLPIPERLTPNKPKCVCVCIWQCDKWYVDDLCCPGFPNMSHLPFCHCMGPFL